MGGALRFCWIGVVLAVPSAVLVQACGYSSGECSDKSVCPDIDGALLPDTSPNADGNGGNDTTVVDAPFDSLVIPDGPLADGTCNMGIEDCTNDKDDNCNGLVDCADPVCTGAGYSCAEPAPNGWKGPMTLQEANNLAACAAPFAQPVADASSGFNAPAATCTCSCPNPAMGETCLNAANVTLYTGSGCGSSCSSFGLPPNGFCFGGLSCMGGTYSVNAAAPTPQNGSCNPKSSTIFPAPTWTTSSRTCAYSGPMDPGGCTNNAQCISKPAAPFGGVCVAQLGDLACPAPYSTKHLYYSGFTENRSCTACTCNSPTGGTCNTGTLNYYSDSGCNTKITTTPFGACVNFSTGNLIHGVDTGPFSLGSAGTCTSSGGAPQGSATPSGPTTVCCK